MVSHSKSKVYFFFQQKGFSLRNRSYLKKIIEYLFKNEGKRLNQISYIFCSDEQLLLLNKKYLNRNYYTDIITFDLSENKHSIRGDSYISINRTKDNARHLGIPFQFEICRIIFHGALHLCGYSDKHKKDLLTMRKREEFYLSLFFKHP